MDQFWTKRIHKNGLITNLALPAPMMQLWKIFFHRIYSKPFSTYAENFMSSLFFVLPKYTANFSCFFGHWDHFWDRNGFFSNFLNAKVFLCIFCLWISVNRNIIDSHFLFPVIPNHHLNKIRMSVCLFVCLFVCLSVCSLSPPREIH
mgnify:CR=1 FL=1